MLAARALWHQVHVYVSTFLLQAAVYAKEPALLRYLCHPGKVAQARTNSISVWKAIYKPAFCGMTLLIRLGKAEGGRGACFTSPLTCISARDASPSHCAQKRLLIKLNLGQFETRKEKCELHPAVCRTLVLVKAQSVTFSRTALLLCVLRHSKKAQAFLWRALCWFAHLIWPAEMCLRTHLCMQREHNLKHFPQWASHCSYLSMSLCLKWSTLLYLGLA